MDVEEHIYKAIQDLSIFPVEFIMEAFMNVFGGKEIREKVSPLLDNKAEKKVYNAMSRGLRREIIAWLDGYKCVFCGAELGEDYLLSYFNGPVKSFEEGLYTIFTSCGSCNKRKKGMHKEYPYEKLIQKRKDNVLVMIDFLWHDKIGRRALKRAIKAYRQIMQEEGQEDGNEEIGLGDCELEFDRQTRDIQGEDGIIDEDN
ncbi:MAG: hypothetical protein WC476_01250 [Phycisphaerae bacterium]|jgi:hypothetical protein